MSELNYKTLGPLMRILNTDDADPSSDIVIYHYAPLASFVSLLKTNCFWATHFRFLNDPTEVKYGQARLTKCLQQLVSDESFLKPFAEIFNVIASDLVARQNNFQFIVSFTTLRDNLNFWRHYGDGGHGVCFGFRVADLVKSYRKGNEFGTDLRAIRYDEETQLSELRTYLESAIKIADSSDPFMKTFLRNSLENFAPTFKPPVFQVEDEWRLVVGNFVSERVPGYRRKLHFRPSGKSILPYVEVDIAPNASLQPFQPEDRLQTGRIPIAHVIVGRKMADRDRLALEMALDAFGHDSAVVTASEIPIA